MKPDHLRSYLLGRLSRAEREKIETRVFEDDAFDSELQEAEVDLLDDWARGKLTAADAAQVKQRFPAAKRNFAVQLAAKTGERSPRRRNRQIWWVAAAAVILCLAPAVYFRGRPLPATSSPSTDRPPAPAAGQVAVVALRVPSSRGSAIPVFPIERPAATIRITAPAISGYREHEVRLESAERGPVARKVTVPAGGNWSAEFDAALIPDGDYDCLVFGKTGDVSDLLASYNFRIQRR